MLEIDVPQDYAANPNQMPRPYITFETRSKEQRQADGSVTYADVVWVKVVAPGGKDILEKLADDWIAGLKQHAEAGRIPTYWPSEYAKALAAFKEGEELPSMGTPIKSWPPLSPSQRNAVLNANVLTVEDLAQANDEMKARIGMGAEGLVSLAKTWVRDAQGPGALARQLEAEQVANADLRRQVEELSKAVTELTLRLPKEQPGLKVT